MIIIVMIALNILKNKKKKGYKMAKIKIDKKSLQVYNILQKLDVVKNVKQGIIIDHENWQRIVDYTYHEVYNDKD
tara:strand:- start:49 stop:273 length:225 start_codon:yes stop_codon:yes gene_type:complete